MQYIYRITGAPEPVIKNSRLARKVLDPYNQRKLDCHMQLVNQHGNQPPLTGAWHLEAQFMFPARETTHNQHHCQAPSIQQLLRFIDDIARGVLYDNECIFYEIKAWKDYSNQFPETTLIFTRK